jgi:hypothetical protein
VVILPCLSSPLQQEWPSIGSVVDYLEDRRCGGKPPAVPRNVALPFALGSRTEIPPLAGPYATRLVAPRSG